MRRSYVFPMRWMVIYGYEVPGGTLNLSSTKLPRPWSPWESFPSRKNPHGRTGNRTRDLMICSQKLWTLDHEPGQQRIIVSNKLTRMTKGCESCTVLLSRVHPSLLTSVNNVLTKCDYGVDPSSADNRLSTVVVRIHPVPISNIDPERNNKLRPFVIYSDPPYKHLDRRHIVSLRQLLKLPV
jgi:hypothetical protein